MAGLNGVSVRVAALRALIEANGGQINMWPPELPNGKLMFPSFVKIATGG